MSSEISWWGDFFSAEKKKIDSGIFIIFIFTLYFCASVTEPENPLFLKPYSFGNVSVESAKNTKLHVGFPQAFPVLDSEMCVQMKSLE